MIDFNYKKSNTVLQVKHTALYKKAIAIYELSRKLNQHNNLITSSQETSPYPIDQLRLREDLTVVSIRLPYTIALAHTTTNYSLKLRSSKLVLQSIERLSLYCKELIARAARDTDDVMALNKELRSFNRMYNSWRLILTQQN